MTPEFITVKLPPSGEIRSARAADYVKAKAEQLRAFGYASLTDQTVEEQLAAVIAGKTLETGLTVIGKFIEDEVLTRSAIT